MIYNLVLVIAAGVTTVGSFNDIGTCTNAQAQFQKQNVVAACVQQESPEEAMQRVQSVLGLMQKFMQDGSKN
jgi:hypothetical protein